VRIEDPGEVDLRTSSSSCNLGDELRAAMSRATSADLVLGGTPESATASGLELGAFRGDIEGGFRGDTEVASVPELRAFNHSSRCGDDLLAMSFFRVE
jgi:hypothetical protein